MLTRRRAGLFCLQAGYSCATRAAIAQALLERRIPSIAAFREMEAGALISYGFDLMGVCTENLIRIDLMRECLTTKMNPIVLSKRGLNPSIMPPRRSDLWRSASPRPLLQVV